MAACAHCGGCCAHCSASCGHFGGASAAHVGSVFSGGGFGRSGLGFHPFFGNSAPAPVVNDGMPPIDCDALVDPANPGHVAAIQTFSHVDDEKHSSLLKWLEEELAKLEG